MSAAVMPSTAIDVVGKRRRKRRQRWAVVPGTSGDHPAVYFFLQELFQRPGRAEFKASIDDPFYEPHDRLLVKRGRDIVGHALAKHREVHFGPLELPVGWLSWLGTSPECRRLGLGTRLLAAAEEHLRRTGALVGLLKTDSPHFFRRSGWALCGRHSFSRADARAVLSELLDRGLRRRRRSKLQIRPFRRWELGALERIYNQNVQGTYGPLVRTEAYWQWLERRRGYDQIYVALDGPELLELDEVNTRPVGYAVTLGEQIVEIHSAPDFRKLARAELLARCCGDAIEHSRYGVLLRAPEGHPLYDVFQAARGRHLHHVADRGQVYMAKLLDPPALLGRLGGELHRRADEARLSRPLDLGLWFDGKKLQLELRPDGVRVVPGRMGRSYLRMNVADFTRLLLGQLDWDVALRDARITASTPLAQTAARALFPPLPLWYPPFDELTA